MRFQWLIFTTIIWCFMLAGCNIEHNVEHNDEQIIYTNDERIIYTSEDIYLKSFRCDYISQDEKPESILVIENADQLAFAETRYGLNYPEGKSEEDIWYYNTSIIDAFQEMKSMYPLDEYTYVVEYNETSSGMYYYNADKLVIDGDRLYFEMDDESKNGNNYDVVTCDMSGWCYLAAVPKYLFSDKIFISVIYPDSEDITQDILYSSQKILDIYNSSLYELYGNQPYVISSYEENEEFFARADALKIENDLFQYLKTCNYNFEQVKVVYLFYERDNSGMTLQQNDISIENGEVIIDYEMIQNDVYHSLDETKTCVLRIILPATAFE